MVERWAAEMEEKGGKIVGHNTWEFFGPSTLRTGFGQGRRYGLNAILQMVHPSIKFAVAPESRSIFSSAFLNPDCTWAGIMNAFFLGTSTALTHKALAQTGKLELFKNPLRQMRQ